MSTTNDGVVGFGRTFVEQFGERDVTYNAASIAYYAFVSLIPLLLLVLVLATTFGGQDLANRITQQAGNSLPNGAGQLLTSALTGSTGAGGATVVGIVTLVWSALKVFRGLDIAFSRMYAHEGPDGIAEQVKDGLVALVGVVLGTVVTVAVAVVISSVDIALVIAGVDLFGLLVSLVLIAALAVVLFPLYYYLPAENVTAREAIPGAIFASVGLVVLQTVFRIYAGQAGKYAAYGVIGAVLLLVTILYFASIVLLCGVLLNAILADRLGVSPDRE